MVALLVEPASLACALAVLLRDLVRSPVVAPAYGPPSCLVDTIAGRPWWAWLLLPVGALALVLAVVAARVIR